MVKMKRIIRLIEAEKKEITCMNGLCVPCMQISVISIETDISVQRSALICAVKGEKEEKIQCKVHLTVIGQLNI